MDRCPVDNAEDGHPCTTCGTHEGLVCGAQPAFSSTLNTILAERGPRYGPFSDNAVIAQSLKEIMHNSPNWRKLTSVHQEALDLIAMKISRILSTGADLTHRDNWDDIAGYATLATKDWSKHAPPNL